VPLVALLALLLAVVSPAAARPNPGAVATEVQLAADAGAEVLRAGGSAADAAIAAEAAVCVVHAQSCGVGGGGFAIVRTADGKAAVLDYREVAPAGATPDRFLTDGKPDQSKLRVGGLAVGVPGEIAGWLALHDRYGRVPLATVLAPAIRLARDGFALDDAPALRKQIEGKVDLLRGDPALRATFLDADGNVPGAGFRVVQRDLGATIDAAARRGARSFYEGPTAAAIAAAVQSHGGVLTANDLARYRVVWRQPLRGTYRGREVLTLPPPASGGIVLEALGILANDDPAALGAETPTWLHLLGGTMAMSFADRARWYGDPAFTDVPVAGLLDPGRLAEIREQLRATQRLSFDGEAARGNGTAHVSVVDTAGNAVSLTTTINTSFGAGIVVPGTGIILNNEMDDFSVAPGVPNVYGLVGTAANAVAPGKRPQSSISATIVLRDRTPELVVGGSGGPFIISGTLQVVLGVVAFGRSLKDAVEAPRIHDQGVPNVLLVEPAIPEEVRRVLTLQGDTVKEFKSIGAVAAAGLGRDGAPAGAGDPRKDGGEAVVR
jgi:gamma-glutamyltranspeptidase/glutathione hydrolase